MEDLKKQSAGEKQLTWTKKNTKIQKEPYKSIRLLGVKILSKPQMTLIKLTRKQRS